MKKFQKIFEKEWLYSWPAPWIMRKQFSERWQRFHTLPRGKRYPSNKAETDEIYRKCNTICSDIFGEGANIYIIVLRQKLVHLSARDRRIYMTEAVVNSLEFEYSFDEFFAEEEEVISWDVYSTADHWKSARFNNIFMELALDKRAVTIFTRDDSTAIVAPYDGGIDVFCSSQIELQRLCRKYSDWRSRDIDGL